MAEGPLRPDLWSPLPNLCPVVGGGLEAAQQGTQRGGAGSAGVGGPPPKVQAWHQWCLAWGILPLFLRGRALLRGGHAVGGQLVRPEPVLSREAHQEGGALPAHTLFPPHLL